LDFQREIKPNSKNYSRESERNFKGKKKTIPCACLFLYQLQQLNVTKQEKDIVKF